MRDLVVIGAGPFGVAAAAEAKAKGINYVLVGKPLKFWKESMPDFMLLRSPFIASSLYDPEGKLSLKKFYDLKGRKHTKGTPVPFKIYLEYLDWYMENAKLSVIDAEVESVNKNNSGEFEVSTSNGEKIVAKTVIVAVGNPPFATVPKELNGINKKYITHTRDIPEFGHLAGKDVLVVGAGQSALEACYGLIRSGAKVKLSHRQKGIYWHNIPLRINVPLLHFFVACPTVLEWVPYFIRKPVSDYVTQATVDKWLREKVEGKLEEYRNTSISGAQEIGDKVKVKFSNGQSVEVDHIVLGTGYSVDIKNLDILDNNLLQGLVAKDGYPVINGDLESTVPGLFFTGLPAKGRFGPTFNFIFASGSGAKRVISGVKNKL